MDTGSSLRVTPTEQNRQLGSLTDLEVIPLCAMAQVERKTVRAKFAESVIWKHYTDVNGKFWVFSDRPNNAAGI